MSDIKLSLSKVCIQIENLVLFKLSFWMISIKFIVVLFFMNQPTIVYLNK